MAALVYGALRHCVCLVRCGCYCLPRLLSPDGALFGTTCLVAVPMLSLVRFRHSLAAWLSQGGRNTSPASPAAPTWASTFQPFSLPTAVMLGVSAALF
jgi:hypothetical protein